MTGSGNSLCFDVVVVGAGPAGSSAALALARAGRSVAVLEKAVLPRYKTCGGGLLSRAYKLLQPGVAAVVERQFQSVAFSAGAGNLNYVVTRPEPLVYMTMRADLDELLARDAVRAGARLFTAFAAKHVRFEDGYVQVEGGEFPVRAKFVVAADGVHSAVAKAAGWPGFANLAPALEYEIHPAPQAFGRVQHMPRFDFDVVPGGYAWVFPKRDHLSAGILSTQRVCPHLPSALAGYLHGLGLDGDARVEKHGYLIPLSPRRSPLAQGRVLLVGDAAGLVDPVTTEGITHAVLSGQLAAAALLEGKLDADKVGAIYQARLEESILPELRAARVLARVLYHCPRFRNAVFRLNGQRLCEFVANVVMGQASYVDALKRPLNYLKLLKLAPRRPHEAAK